MSKVKNKIRKELPTRQEISLQKFSELLHDNYFKMAVISDTTLIKKVQHFNLFIFINMNINKTNQMNTRVFHIFKSFYIGTYK